MKNIFIFKQRSFISNSIIIPCDFVKLIILKKSFNIDNACIGVLYVAGYYCNITYVLCIKSNNVSNV